MDEDKAINPKRKNIPIDDESMKILKSTESSQTIFKEFSVKFVSLFCITSQMFKSPSLVDFASLFNTVGRKTAIPPETANVPKCSNEHEQK
jgi:hypothetical protein